MFHFSRGLNQMEASCMWMYPSSGFRFFDLRVDDLNQEPRKWGINHPWANGGWNPATGIEVLIFTMAGSPKDGSVSTPFTLVHFAKGCY